MIYRFELIWVKSANILLVKLILNSSDSWELKFVDPSSSNMLLWPHSTINKKVKKTWTSPWACLVLFFFFFWFSKEWKLFSKNWDWNQFSTHNFDIICVWFLLFKTNFQDLKIFFLLPLSRSLLVFFAFLVWLLFNVTDCECWKRKVRDSCKSDK